MFVTVYVALDLETTGLSPQQDEIIEVGAVRFDEDGVVDTFTSLVNPGCSIPYRIQMLTGIATNDVQDAPHFHEVESALRDFLGHYPIVGQNVSFDLGFLARQGIHPNGEVYDTREIASLLLIGLSDHSLATLAKHLSVDFPVRHRALPDAVATKDVFLALRQRAKSLPVPVLAELAQLDSAGRWPLAGLFRRWAEESLAATTAPTIGAPSRALLKSARPAEPLVPLQARKAIGPQEVEKLIRAAVHQPKIMPGFEERPQQLAMARAVAQALDQQHHLIVEAGTGVGKSLAYLVPAACYALSNNDRVVISTDTINLQEQLVRKDIPALVGLLRAQERWREKASGLRAVQLKGRSNYLCLQRWETTRVASARSADEARFYARVLLWLPQTETGDRGELNLSSKEEAYWSRLSAQNENCLAGPCPYVRDGSCFLLRARRRAESAHLVVVNHALLLSDLATGGKVLPPYDYLIIDEAHNLEEEATRQLGFEVREVDIIDCLNRLHGQSGGQLGGLVSLVRRSAQSIVAALSPAFHVVGIAETVAGAVEGARRRTGELLLVLQRFVAQHAPESGDYQRSLWLTNAVRTQPDWSSVEIAWENFDLAIAEVEKRLASLQEALLDGSNLGLADHERLLAEANTSLQVSQELRRRLGSVLGRYDPQLVSWLAWSQQNNVAVAAAPLEVAPILARDLFKAKKSVVLTSATLTSQGSFQYVRGRIGLEEAEELALGSPFDFASSALLLIPKDIPEPERPGHQAAVVRALAELCTASEGRALALFTSHAALQAAYNAIQNTLKQENITVLGQGIDGSPQELLSTLRSQPRTVLLGTASFWEGVDVVGEALSLLVMAKLPFTVPSEPIFAARSALYDDPFGQYAVPQAVLRFRQGFGRLIRSRDDRGVVVVLDRRLRSRRYGQAFLDSLPPCELAEVRLAEAPDVVRQWLLRKKESSL